MSFVTDTKFENLPVHSITYFRTESDVQAVYGAVEQADVQIGAQQREEDENCCARNFPQPRDVLAGFVTVLKRREGKKRLMILMLVFNFACYIFAYNGTEGTHR